MFRFKNVAIESMGVALPGEVLTSHAIEEILKPLYERLKLPFGRLEMMTGIKERRMWPEGTQPSQASAKAGAKVLSKTRFAKDEFDLLIHAAVCRDRLEPATAAYVHHSLGLPAHTQFMDVSNACLGFMNAILNAASMVESGQIKRALIVSGENGRPLVETTIKKLLEPLQTRNSIKPFFANLTIGSGAVAAVVCHKSCLQQTATNPEHAAYRAAHPAAVPALNLLSGVSQNDTAATMLCEGGSANSAGDGLDMQTDSEGLLAAGIALADRTWAQFKKQTGWTELTPAHFIPHQVGTRHLSALYEALKLDPKRFISSFETLGNMGSASLPITLAQGLEKGRILPGDKLALLGIGSGLSTLIMGCEAMEGV